MKTETLIDTIEYRDHKIEIHSDLDPMNPRTEYDNVGVMFCKYRRYTLGDKDAKDPFESINIYVLDDDQDDSASSKWYRIDEPNLAAAQEMLAEWHDHILHEKESEAQRLDAERTFEAYDYLTHLCSDDCEQRLRPDIALCIPMWMYDHSGITIWHGNCNPPQDTAGWDSGQVGWHYVTKANVDEEWNDDLDKARAYLEGEMQEYDDYVRGAVYGYVVDGDGDSCWGFYGDDHEKSGLLEQARSAVDYAIRQHIIETDTEAMTCD